MDNTSLSSQTRTGVGVEDLRSNPFRDRFIFEATFESQAIDGVSQHETVYLDGNSLGRLPRSTLERMDQVLRREWGDQLISSWNAHWLGLANRIGRKSVG